MTDVPAPTALETSAENPWPVRHLSPKIHEYVSRMTPVWVEGQAVNVKRWRNLVFLTLRDSEADMSIPAMIPAAAADALEPPLADGARIVVHAKPEWRLKNGSLQLHGREVRGVGIGELLARIEKLRTELAAEGLFEDGRKISLPYAPSRIGLICATEGDAEHDVVVNATARWPQISFEIRRVTVQGASAVQEVSEAIAELDALPEVEVIVIARGGGSLEDLLPFSAEALIRSAAECTTPLVSAIGHEKDSPLLDLVADMRASTPTDAGKRIVPDAQEESDAIARILKALRTRIEVHLDNAAQSLMTYVTRPVLVHPQRWLTPHIEDIARVHRRSAQALVTTMTTADARITHARASLRALSPHATLARGYAVIRDATGKVVRDATALQPHDTISMQVAHGHATATVTAVQKETPSEATSVE